MSYWTRVVCPACDVVLMHCSCGYVAEFHKLPNVSSRSDTKPVVSSESDNAGHNEGAGKRLTSRNTKGGDTPCS